VHEGVSISGVSGGGGNVLERGLAGVVGLWVKRDAAPVCVRICYANEDLERE
jgi:hypothetical protein